MKMKFIGSAITAFLLFNVHVSTAFAQGATAFTYQGRLLNNGADANGTNGMIFTLYGAATGGTAIGSPITNNVVTSNGLFSVNLDFGAGAFNGSARWLDIAISNGVTNVDLSPRAQILPTPYATFAGTASNVVGGVVATGTFLGNGIGLLDVAANLQMEVYSTPGAYYFIVPTNVSTIIVEAWGGGGGGGNGNVSYDTSGGGGGAGGYSKVYYGVTPGASYQIVVGGGGSAGVAGGYSGIAGSLLASGGSAGASGSSTGLTSGGAGGSGVGTSTTASGIRGGYGKFGTVDGGGDGGSAGSGGAGGLGNIGGGGTAGNSPGGGGGGGDYVGTVTGYAGGNGEVIVYY